MGRADFLRKIAVEGEKGNADLTETINDELGMPMQKAEICDALTRMIIHESRYEEAVELVKSKAENLVLKDCTSIAS